MAGVDTKLDWCLVGGSRRRGPRSGGGDGSRSDEVDRHRGDSLATWGDDAYIETTRRGCGVHAIGCEAMQIRGRHSEVRQAMTGPPCLLRWAAGLPGVTGACTTLRDSLHQSDGQGQAGQHMRQTQGRVQGNVARWCHHGRRGLGFDGCAAARHRGRQRDGGGHAAMIWVAKWEAWGVRSGPRVGQGGPPAEPCGRD